MLSHNNIVLQLHYLYLLAHEKNKYTFFKYTSTRLWVVKKLSHPVIGQLLEANLTSLSNVPCKWNFIVYAYMATTNLNSKLKHTYTRVTHYRACRNIHVKKPGMKTYFKHVCTDTRSQSVHHNDKTKCRIFQYFETRVG